MNPTRRLASAALFAAATLAAAPATAQQGQPLSPPAKATASVGDHTVTVDYSSPRVRGRQIMGGLVPYGKVWRTGANAATTLTTSGDLTIGDLHVPAGKYTLYTIPGETEWTLIVNKQTGQWGTNYDQAQDLGRVPMKVAELDAPREEMTIAVTPGEAGKATLAIEWESTSATVELTAH